MEFIEEQHIYTYVKRVYGVPELTDRTAAVTWLYEAIDRAGIEVDLIEMEDLLERFEDGAEIYQFSDDIALEDLIEAANHKRIDVVTLSGVFEGCDLTLRIDFRDFSVSITEDDTADMNLDMLEAFLMV